MVMTKIVLARPSELRVAEWSEFDLNQAEGRIPASRMKMIVQHIVPLRQQALRLPREFQRRTDRGAS